MDDAASLSGRPWVFEAGQRMLCPAMWLIPGGGIGGHVSGNEHRWQYEHGQITFLNREGNAASILSRQPDADGREIFAGGLLHDRTGTKTRVLTRRKPRVGCFLRTHFWAPTVARAYARVAEAWGGEVIICSDQTNGFKVPEGIAEIPHSIAEFVNMGLSCHPLASRMLWFNGDYVFYSLAMKTDFDVFVLNEYDLALNGFDLRAAVNGMVADGMDMVGPGLGKRGPAWGWTASQTAWLRAEIAHANSAEDFDQVYGVFFPFIVMSRQAALHLYSRRLEIARLWRTGQVKEAWPHCESFTATELQRGGFRIGDLSKYVPAERLHMSVDNVWSWPEVDASSRLMVHPVVEGARFARKVSLFGRMASRQAGLGEVEWMRQQLGRAMSDEDRGALETAIEEVAAAPPRPLPAAPPGRERRQRA